MSKDQVQEGKQVSKGLFVITLAKLWFMVGGALITFGLPYLFNRQGQDGRVLYGQYNDLNNTLSILTMVIVTGGMQTISRFTSQAKNQDELFAMLKQLLKFMLSIGAILSIGFIASADLLAQSRGNIEIVNAYRLAGLVILAYSAYIVFVGALNGKKEFVKQALFDIGFTTIKAILVLGFALLGLGVVGAFLGFGISAILIAVLAFFSVGLGAGKSDFKIDQKQLFVFALNAMLYALIFNLMFKLDILMIKPVLQRFGNNVLADQGIGVYSLAVNISRLPWQATIAVTFVIFPILSEATFGQDLEKAVVYIRQSLRYLSILIGMASAVLMAYPKGIALFLPTGYQFVGELLIWLAPAYFFFSLFNLVNTILISANHPSKALLIGVITSLVVSVLYWFYLPMGLSLQSDLIQETILIRGAQCTLFAFALGFALGLWILVQEFGTKIVQMASALRLALAISIVTFVGWFVLPQSQNKIVVLGILGLLALLYLIILFVTKEFTAEDIERFQRIIRRKK